MMVIKITVIIMTIVIIHNTVTTDQNQVLWQSTCEPRTLHPTK